MKKLWRKLDNTAKIFSLEEKKNTNIFRLSSILKEQINEKILKSALIKTLDMYPNYKVKIKSGLFWNYLEFNSKEPIIEEENQIPCRGINFKENNDYLFKVTYFNNKINLEIFHVLTDGVGAITFLKGILYNYLDLKYNLESINHIKKQKSIFYQDEYLKNADKKLICKEEKKKSFLIKEEANCLDNKTYHYILDLKKFKSICKKNDVSITEYLTAIYIYALYKSVYDKSSNKDIRITVPIDLRKHYQVETFSNFFACMSVEGNVTNNKKVTFNKILTQVHKEFKNKLTTNNIKSYLARDVKLGTNIGIRLVPLFMKKLVIQNLGKILMRSSTTTLSNIGPINIDNKYKKYIDNIMTVVNVGKIQKVKCTVCSYENNLTITINSNLINSDFEKKFYSLLKKYIGEFKVESNIH